MTGPYNGMKERVLIVDDEKHVAAALTRVLDEDFEVVTVPGAAEGLAVLRDMGAAVVLSDYRMPGMNGVEFLRRVRAEAPESIRILITGQTEHHIAVDAINTGHVYRFLIKPWDNEDLLITLRQAAELHRLQQERRRLIGELHEKTEQLEYFNRDLEGLVEQRTQQLLHADKLALLGQMAALIGHEIKNVLTLLRGRVQLLGRSLGKAKQVAAHHRALRTFDEGIERLAYFATNLQSLGRPERQAFTELDLTALVQETIGNLRDVGMLKDYTIRTDYPPGPAVVSGDAGQLEQLFINLLVNAHHAMDGTGTLTVTVRAGEEAHWAVSITDTGCGIPEDALERVFEPFYTTKPEGTGTGLGMVVVQQVVERHGGVVQVESKEGIGTTVTIHLPVLVGASLPAGATTGA